MKASNLADRSKLMGKYNKAKAYARRTGLLEEKRVNRAWGLIMADKLDEKVEQYGTRLHWCGCPDSQMRDQTCKHQIGLMIVSRASETEPF